MKEKKLFIQGMVQESDGELVKEAVLNVWGVRQVAMDLSRAEAKVFYNSEAASEMDIEQAILDQGFRINKEVQDE